MQQYASTLSVLTHTLAPGKGSKVKKNLKLVILHIRLKGNMQAHILSLHIPSTPGVESKSQTIIFFTENSHVAYQIKGKGTQSTMQAVSLFSKHN